MINYPLQLIGIIAYPLSETRDFLDSCLPELICELCNIGLVCWTTHSFLIDWCRKAALLTIPMLVNHHCIFTRALIVLLGLLPCLKLFYLFLLTFLKLTAPLPCLLLERCV